MKRMMGRWIMWWGALAVARPGIAEEAAPASPVWQEGIAVVGSVRVDPRTRTVSAAGWVNQVSGAMELLACGKAGKTHESVFVLDVNPMDLQTGLLLLGLQPGTPPVGLGDGMPSGPELELWVDWKDGDQERSLRAEQFIWNVEDDAPLPETGWVFTGSMIEDGEFKAMAEESLIATYWDPWAIINLPLPCGANDEILLVATNTVPALHTPITMRCQARAAETPSAGERKDDDDGTAGQRLH